MGRVPEPHTSPKAPEDRAWDWHGSAEADKSDAILESGGWKLLADAYAWYDPSQDEAGNDPPHEKGAYKLPHHEIEGGRIGADHRTFLHTPTNTVKIMKRTLLRKFGQLAI